MNSSLISISRYDSDEEIRNEFGDSKFKVQDPMTGAFYIIDFSWQCSLAKVLYGQMLFINGNASHGYADSENRIVVSSLSSARQEIAYIRDICEYWERCFPNRTLQSLTRAEVQEMLQSFVIRQGLCGEELLSYKTVKAFASILNRSNLLMYKGKLVDGILHFITDKLKRAMMAPLLERNGIEYSEWKKGGSYGSIPLTCASLMLAEAIKIIECESSKIAVEFFKSWRKYKGDPNHWFSKNDRLSFYRKIQADPGSRLSARQRSWQESALEFGSAIDNITTEKLDKLPWAYFGEFSDFCSELSKACLVVCILLSGFRISEIGGMYLDDYEQEVDGSWWFKSQNYKTESGFSHPRSLHGLVAESATILKNLSAVDPDKYILPFFNNGYRSAAFQAELGWGHKSVEEWLNQSKYNTKTLSKWFKKFYQTKVVELYPDSAFYHKSVSPHQARHTFAEFAIRRFDGNVFEKIREHFRHSKGSFHTRRYTQNKLQESIRMSLERDYLKEIIGRFAGNNISDCFYGPAATKIERDVRRMSFLTEDEFNAALKTYLDEFQRFVAFEWGFCALRVNEAHSAKCCDSKTGTPNVDQYSSPDVCAGCPHGMHNNIQKQELERVAIAHQFIAENHPLSALGHLSSMVVTKIERRLNSGEKAS